MFVKICGIRDEAAGAAAVRAGADAVGFVFSASPRRISPGRAAALAADLPPFLLKVAVLYRPSPDATRRVLDEFRPDVIQVETRPPGLDDGIRWWPVLHDDGDEFVSRAAGLPPREPVLLEAAGRGGRGSLPDWCRAGRVAVSRPVILAGGLRPDNVVRAIREVRPWGVDVSSGVESSPGCKSPQLIDAFVRSARTPVPEPFE